MMETDASKIIHRNTDADASTELSTPKATPVPTSNDDRDQLLQNLTPLFSYLFFSGLMPSPSSPHSLTTASAATRATTVRRMNDQMQNVTEANHYRDLLNRYIMTLIRVKDLIRENNALCEDNLLLRSAYEGLNRQFTRLLCRASSRRGGILTASSSSTSSFDSSPCGGDPYLGGEFFSDFSPTSVLDEFDDYRNADRLEETEDRLSLPKSISVRSSDYRKMHWPLVLNRSGHHAGDWNRDFSMNGSATAPIQFGAARTQGRERIEVEEKAVMPAADMNISKQGMYKTELCNNWREKGNCPYGQSCRFAHGISELRPVIRHRKYKTEICRMIFSVGSCPYGHRCHFRHSLNLQ